MARIVAIANQKGGVGKTTTCVNLSAALHGLGYRVLMVDCDPQGNGSSGMGVKKTTRPNTYDLLIHQAEPESCIVHTSYGDVIPTGKELAAASVELIGQDKREFVLKNALQQLFTDYDYIFIDCPPSLELLTVDALVAADSVLIPMQCEYYALEGIADLMTSIRICKRKLNRKLEDRRISLEKAGSIAEASLGIAKVFTAAQEAAKIYLENLREKSGSEIPAGQALEDAMKEST